WDRFANGHIDLDLIWVQYHLTNDLVNHWPTTTSGGKPPGDPDSLEWIHGKRLIKRCLDVICCSNQQCQVIIRPLTRADQRSAQILQPCPLCGSTLSHITCTTPGQPFPATTTIYKWRNGGAQVNLQLRRYHRFFANADRVRKTQQKVRAMLVGKGHGFIAEFAAFVRDHPNFIRHQELGEWTVITMQTPFMCLLLVDSGHRSSVLSLVANAAHGFYKDMKALLIITSVHCKRLLCGVPTIISYSNGQTAEHYLKHFFAQFESIVEDAWNRGIDRIDDEWLGTTVDFSTAQRNGFIAALTQLFRKHQPGQRTDDELCDVAEKLLRGCQDHFLTGAIRVSNISGAVNPKDKPQFRNRARHLLKVEDPAEFIAEVEKMAASWPKSKNWLKWWTTKEHTSMLFPSQIIMDRARFDRLLDTTNREELIHFKLYQAVGKDVDVIDGFYWLYWFCDYFLRLYLAASGE
ncbi:hypothetical protein C8J56DRAFT_803407, partial [Mycena floridula]